MIHTCELCGSDFLTEADPYVVRPTPNGLKLYCMCQIKGFEEMKGAEKLQAKNAELEKKLEIAVDFIKSVPDAHEHYGHELNSLCDDTLAAIKEKEV